MKATFVRLFIKTLTSIFLTVLFLWQLVCSQIIDGIGQTEFKASYSVQNKVLENHVIKTVQSLTIASTCMMECSSNMGCYSYNLYPATGLCELNNATHLSHPYDYVYHPGGGNYLRYFLRSIGWCNDKLCGGDSCLLNEDQNTYKCKGCSDALGLEDGSIPDSAFTASSYEANLVKKSYPYYGRLNSGKNWAVEFGQVEVGQWLQVDLGNTFKVKKIATQGRPGIYKNYVTKYKIAYKLENEAKQFYKESGVVKVFDGNTDQSSVVTNTFTEGVVTRYIRIVVQAWNKHISMRVEYYGCRN